jgi:hypothetical protein
LLAVESFDGACRTQPVDEEAAGAWADASLADEPTDPGVPDQTTTTRVIGDLVQANDRCAVGVIVSQPRCRAD